MAKVLITESYLEDIADSIRAKNGTENTYKPSEMAGAIDAISGGSANLEEKTVSPSETPIVVRPSTGYDGMSRVNVNAISDEYVGSMVPRITSLTITDGNVTAPSGYYPNAISDSVVSGTKQISITQNGTTTENVAIYASVEITANVSGGGGGGSTNYQTGKLTLSNDLSLTTSAQNITGLQLSFQPDYFCILPDRTSFEARESYSGGLWGVLAIKKSKVAPFVQSVSATPETETNDYVFFIANNIATNSSITCGTGIMSWGLLGNTYYGRYSINSNGTVSVGRYSSGGTKMFAGDYVYIACKL